MKNETKKRQRPLASVEALVLETSGGEMPDIKVGANREFANARTVFSEKKSLKKKNQKK